MKQTAYIRVSSQKQSYDRQKLELDNYFSSHGIDTSKINYVQEKITSYTTFKERAIYPILRDAKPGDIVYVCQLDRLGRTVEDIIQLVKFADKQGVELLATTGSRITYTTHEGKMMLTMLATVAEMERELRAERCAAGKAAEREELERNGYRTARVSGKIQTRMGNEKKYDMSKAQIAGIEVRQKNAMQWLDQSAAFKRAKNLWLRGKTRREIVAELGELYDVQPEIWGTRKGKRVTEATLSRWLSNMPGVAL